MLTNAELLERLDSAFKAITVGDLGEGVLAPQQFDRFIHAAQHSTVILQEARFIPMDSHQVNIDRTGFSGWILRSGKGEAGASRELPPSEYAKPYFATNKLITEELQAITGIEDRALRRNIERGNFENTLITMFGEAAGRDLEAWFILGDKDIPWGSDPVLNVLRLTDGWAKRAANKIYGGTGGDFNPKAENWPENLFEALLQALPKQYLQDPSEWRFYVDWEVENAYRDLLKKRQTALGDAAVTTAPSLSYKNIPVKYVPMIGRSKSVAENGAGDIAMLQHPDNMVWGIFHEITIERDRVAKARRTDFVLTVEGDADYEDENAAVVAFIDQDRIES